MRRRYPLWLYMGSIFTLLLVIMSSVLGFSGYHMVQYATRMATIQLAEQMSEMTEKSLKEIERSAYLVLESQITNQQTFDEYLDSWSMMSSQLKSLSFLHAVFIGYKNGDFFFVRALRTEAERTALKAPTKTFFDVYSVQNQMGKAISRESYYDENLVFLGETRYPEDGFDPRTRHWYKGAMQTDRYYVTDPYFYFESPMLGITVSKKNPDLKSVAGVDMSLSSLSQMLDTLSPTPGTRIVIVKPNGVLIAHTTNLPRNNTLPLMVGQEANPVISSALEKYKKGERGLLERVRIDGKEWVLFINNIGFSENNDEWILLLAMPFDEVMRNSQELLHRTLQISFFILLFSLPFIWYATQRIVEPLQVLIVQTQKIKEFNFDDDGLREHVNSHITEVHLLSRTISILRDNIKRFLSINSAINKERDLAKLLDLILVELSKVANAEGGIISLLDERGQYRADAKFYYKKLFKNKSKKFLKKISMEQFKGIMPSALDICNSEFIHMTVTREDPAVAIDNFASVFNDPEVQYLDIIHLPLLNSTDECLGVLTFIKRVDNLQSSFQENHVFFIKTLVDVASVALEDHRLLESEHNLLVAMVRIIAGAIDAKSPYTGAHCQRVPVIFNMILEAANDAQEGELKDFICTDEEKEEANFAAWLHDCGKVTTPEYIVDKATKLETIYDRIHEIRMRFEVLKRDVEIACLKDIINGSDPQERNRQAEEALRALDDEFTFIAHCNDGSEYLDAAALERLQVIGKRIWKRTLDKRLGVSKDELARMGDIFESLPVFEELLSDKAEHIIKRSPGNSTEEYKSLGVISEPPENLYNRGELYNLSITRGTLNFEERYKINDHVTQTMIMLNKLPLPKRMKNIPNLAGAHHETLDGKGYPRQLQGDDIDIKARMLVIADIFEALTASDRPYKSAKTLSEALKVMKWFRDNNHIDSNLYDLFIRENIPQKYAKEYLRPDQCDL